MSTAFNAGLAKLLESALLLYSAAPFSLFAFCLEVFSPDYSIEVLSKVSLC